MQSQVIDFRGLIDLDKKIVEQLENYLKEKEVRLSQQIVQLLPSQSTDISSDSTSPISEITIRLADAVEGFIRGVRSASQKNKFDANTAENVVDRLNIVFWDYTEALEGCVTELFQQIKQVSVDRWHLTIANVVSSIKELLTHRIEDLIWTIRRLEQPLSEFCKENLHKPLPFWKKWTQSTLDADLLKNLKQSHKYLQNQYEDFEERHQEFTRLSFHVEKLLDEMKKFPVLALQDIHEQNLYVDVYRLLKLIELNPDPKSTLAHESIRSLKYLTSVDSIYRVFRVYSKELQETLINCSLEYKSLAAENDSPYFEHSLDRLKTKVNEYQNENKHLMATIRNYRDFILKNDSNPYVSSRWGFTERTVGPEPISASKLLNLIYSGESLDKKFISFKESLDLDIDEYFELMDATHQEIDKLLHEMGQPLISHSLLKNRAQRLLDELSLCDEIGSPDLNSIDYVENVLSKAMREDWKYHVLHEFNQFHEIYYTHLGLCARFDDPSHAFRTERFHLFFDQIEGWVKKNDLFTHIHEIELDINDMKTYLQDFLAAIQRSLKEKSQDPFLDDTLQKYRQQLFEYRYIFGQFFSSIMRSSTDGQQLRIQFLFVDQYFETIENLLREAEVNLEDSSFKNEDTFDS